MEFYFRNSKFEIRGGRFNSQWDGILLICDDRLFLLNCVSIPNGMEFYSTNFAIFLGRKC